MSTPIAGRPRLELGERADSVDWGKSTIRFWASERPRREPPAIPSPPYKPGDRFQGSAVGRGSVHISGYQSKVDGRLTAFDPLVPFLLGTRYGRNAHMSGPSHLKQADWGWHFG
jgi:hypothetical protein